jgi:hypothetical protein
MIFAGIDVITKDGTDSKYLWVNFRHGYTQIMHRISVPNVGPARLVPRVID